MFLKTTNEGPDPIDILVGQRLRTLRRQRGLAQTALGAAIGVTFQQIQKYERATNRLSASMLVRAAHALGVRAVDLLPPEAETAADAPGAAHLVHVLVHTRGAEELLLAYANISTPRLRRALLQFAKTLADEESGAGGRAAA